MSYNPHNDMGYDLLPYDHPNNPYSESNMRSRFARNYNPSPSPPRYRDTPSTGYSSGTLSSSSRPSGTYKEPSQEPSQEPSRGPSQGRFHQPTQEPTHSPFRSPTQQQRAPPPSPTQRPSSPSSSSFDTETTYSSASSPSMPELEDQSYAQYSPFSDSEASDTEYTPEPTEPTEPGLEYDTSFSSEEEDEEEDDDDEEDDEESESESEVDEMANRGRPRKRAGSPRRGVREEPAAKVLERSLKESLVALRVQELKKAAADNEKKRETPRWLSFMKKFLVLLLLFVAAFATVWVVNEVHYRGGLPYLKLFRGIVRSRGTWQFW
ncbi:hypothetical protein VE00_04510 [Pseudogymnoascus sp. WSF 3629]|nr:hypothetical protein VE00_04510 [Pseudogymnoascus sp. WSF 3629]